MRVGHVLRVWLAVFVVACRCVAQDATPDASDEEKERIRKEAFEHVKKFVMTGRDDERIEPMEKPLLSSSDPARGEWGSLWAFGTEGRPVAILELYKNTGLQQRWVQVLTLTSDQLVQCRLPTGPVWLPQEKQLELRPLADVPPPADRASLRQRQAKLLARRFDAHEFWDPNNSRFELRLLETPLCTYQDETGGILDGAVFAFVHGTNAEIVVLLEAHAQEEGPPRWMYGLARVGSAEMHVNLGGEEVWQLARTPGVVGNSRDPYWISTAIVASE